MKYSLFFLCLLGSLWKPTSMMAQSKQAFPISISLLDESPNLPTFGFVRYPLHPALRIGTEYLLQQRKSSDWHLAPSIGFWYHPDNEVGLFAQAEFGYRYRLKRWFVAPRIGLGYAHRIGLTPSYVQNGDQWVEATALGEPNLMISGTVNLGFQLQDRVASPELFLSMSQSFHVPFSFYTGYHQFVGLGVQFYPFSTASASKP
ncbi:MAG: hypothetical protein AAF399_07075 [Bacteroidota bacterium]